MWSEDIQVMSLLLTNRITKVACDFYLYSGLGVWQKVMAAFYFNLYPRIRLLDINLTDSSVDVNLVVILSE